jgi:hypothetical protein
MLFASNVFTGGALAKLTTSFVRFLVSGFFNPVENPT